MTYTLAGLQGVSIRAGNAGLIQFPTKNDRERRMVALLNKVADESNATISLTASGNDPRGKIEVCRQMIPLVHASNLPNHDKEALIAFLGAASLKAKRAALLRG